MMRFSLISIYLFFSLILISLIPSILAQCIERPYPTQPKIKIAVDCSMVDEPKKNLKFQVGDTTNMFNVQFDCQIKDNVRCAKAKSTFIEAGRIITSNLKLNSLITIQATFRKMEEPGILGGAGPFRLMPMEDDDGFERLYPQSLVKQFQLSTHPAFAPVDIVADFNSLVSFWFEGDPPITADQIGFLELVLHELMHGLGFFSSWEDYFYDPPQALVPDVIGLTVGEASTDPNATVVFGGFQESAFDKYLILPDNKLTSNLTAELNKFAKVGSTFESVDDFANKFMASPEFLIAKEMFEYCITPKTLIFKPSVSNNEEDITYLETSLNPFQPGSSISHVDRNTYENTSEFLMTYVQVNGRTLEDNIKVGGGGPIGRKLRLILESLGYATKENPNPYKPSPPLSLTSSNNNNTTNKPNETSSSSKMYYTFYSFAVGITMIISILNYL